MWRCDYCGHAQEDKSRKCFDCGGPRPEAGFVLPASYSTVQPDLGIEPPEIWRVGYKTYGEAVDELNAQVSILKTEIGLAIFPALEAISRGMLGAIEHSRDLDALSALVSDKAQ